MIPWVREKFAESRLRWQNRKQRNEIIAPLPLPSNGNSTLQVAVDETQAHSSATNARRLDSSDEITAPTTSAFLQLQANKRHSLSDHVITDKDSNQYFQEFSFNPHQTYGILNADNYPSSHRRPG